MMESNTYVGSWQHLTSVIMSNVLVLAASSKQAFNWCYNVYSGCYGLVYPNKIIMGNTMGWRKSQWLVGYRLFKSGTCTVVSLEILRGREKLTISDLLTESSSRWCFFSYLFSNVPCHCMFVLTCSLCFQLSYAVLLFALSVCSVCVQHCYGTVLYDTWTHFRCHIITCYNGYEWMSVGVVILMPRHLSLALE